MVKLNKIYTRTGDDGTTGLVDGSRSPKHAARIEAIGTVDEANSALGLAICAIPDADDLRRIQNDLFDLGADLAVEVVDRARAHTDVGAQKALQLELLALFSERKAVAWPRSPGPGIPAVILFGIPAHKDATGSDALPNYVLPSKMASQGCVAGCTVDASGNVITPDPGNFSTHSGPGGDQDISGIGPPYYRTEVGEW